jgi:hypothetical protein
MFEQTFTYLIIGGTGFMLGVWMAGGRGTEVAMSEVETKETEIQQVLRRALRANGVVLEPLPGC